MENVKKVRYCPFSMAAGSEPKECLGSECALYSGVCAIHAIADGMDHIVSHQESHTYGIISELDHIAANMSDM